MEIKKEIIGTWKAHFETYEFFDESGHKIHPDQNSTDTPYTVVIDESYITAVEPNAKPVVSTYEIHQDLLDFYLVVFVGTETQISKIKLMGNNLVLISEPEDMKYQKDGVWQKAFKTIYTIEFTRA